MEITAVVLASLGIIATMFVSWLVYIKSSKIINRINAILIARVKPSELHEMERLLEDIERTGEKRGTLVQRENGTWGIDWAITVGGGTIKPTGILRKHLINLIK